MIMIPEAVEGHLSKIEQAAPEVVRAVHVVGSAALGDHNPASSDLDLVVELDRVPDTEDLLAIADAHGAGVDVDALYFLPGELAKPWREAATAWWAREGELRDSRPTYQPDAVTWLQLATTAVTVRGDRPASPADVPAAREACRHTLHSYWQPLLAQAASMAQTTPVLLWTGLGMPRVWHTARTGEIVSKTRGAELAGLVWPDLAAPLRELTAVRADRSIPVTEVHAAAVHEVGRRILGDMTDH
ncbi:hypothetical protein KALB_1235 [Kutzneria albida DSM 43870]|uniref:Polymerase nucleotidyl transferase domain-containing protein n=2 Tax=Kutzneria TaxID=43356 RepID=W5W083_9PSEU|nr:hypothetical protein KALB_1235 [Kutzneria albida DSM 43870]